MKKKVKDDLVAALEANIQDVAYLRCFRSNLIISAWFYVNIFIYIFETNILSSAEIMEIVPMVSKKRAFKINF